VPGELKIYALGEDALATLTEKIGNSPGSGGPPGPTLEPRVAKLEACVEHIQRDVGEIKADLREMRKTATADFRILFGAIIALAIGMAGLMAKGFHWF